MLNLTASEKALASLRESVEVYQDTSFIERLTPKQFHTIRAGIIQNFEFTYELSWKFIKRWLETNLGNTEVDGVSRKRLFLLAAESLLIDDVTLWMQYHKYRQGSCHNRGSVPST
jgi:nucleotidyltransferase substrate binding protein (TIGR01987 family)